MTIYAGETVQIKVTARDFDQLTVLSDDNLISVNITIFDVEGEETLAQTAMTYDEDEAGWVYNWATTSVDAGTYRAKIEATGVSSEYSLEFQRIRLNRRPIGD